MKDRPPDEEVQALAADRYLEALLQSVDADAELDPDVRRTADRLSGELVRVHPSFRFEERLAATLAAAAEAMRERTVVATAVDFPTVERPTPIRPTAPAQVTAPARMAAPAQMPAPGVRSSRAPAALTSAALTSAALSLAGAAVVAVGAVAWRRAIVPRRVARAASQEARA